MINDTWNIDTVVKSATHINNFHASSITATKINNIIIDESLLLNCLIDIANITEAYGEKYIPIFERLKLEINNNKQKQQTKALIREMTCKPVPLLSQGKYINDHQITH